MANPRTQAGNTRDRIVAASTELFSRQGYNATGLKSILTASDSPFGSLYHFFPGGKEELGAEAIRVSGETYRRLVEAFYPEGADVVAATQQFFDGAALMIEATDFADACPIATVALEISSTSEPMREAAADAFNSWLATLGARFAEAGISQDRSAELAIELFCAIEGAFLLSRATRRADSIRVMGRATTLTVQAALDKALSRAGS
ncbi:MAG: TetR/AcrR family transcriptional regulator [Ilumatobacteraceae bacterium]